MLRYISEKGPRLSKLRKVFAPAPPPPDIEPSLDAGFLTGVHASPGHQSVK